MMVRRLAVTLLLPLCAFAACAPDDGPQQSADEARHRYRDAGVATVDAPTSSGGTLSCYTEGNPTQTCSAPDHCCFNNYSAQHDGYCTTAVCAWGTITCDGPEDCASGEYCCAHALTDPDWGTIGYSIACQATACGAPPLNQELCNVSSTCGTRTCVSAAIADYDLPRTLSICQ